MTPRSRRPRPLGEVEQAVMNHVWSHGPVSADDCRLALHSTKPMKESTVRTILRRLEAKGYVTHITEGRTYIYKAVDAPVAVATRAVQHIIDRFCGGSAEELVVGLVDHAVLDARTLERLAKKIADRKGRKS